MDLLRRFFGGLSLAVGEAADTLARPGTTRAARLWARGVWERGRQLPAELVGVVLVSGLLRAAAGFVGGVSDYLHGLEGE